MLNPLKYFLGRKKNGGELSLQFLFQTFRELLDYNNQALDLMADMGEKLGGDYLFDKHYIETVVAQLEEVVYKVVYDLNLITIKKYLGLFDVFEKAKLEIHGELDSRFTLPKGEYVYPLREVTKEMSDYVGEKMATLGELQNRLGLKVPEGFVISTYAFKQFIEYNQLEEWVAPLSEGKFNQEVMEEKAKELKERILQAKMPPELKKAIRNALSSWKDTSSGGWAVRSSAVGEDSQISYAGQYTTVLNVSSSQIDSGYKQVVASLFSHQVIRYRNERGIRQQEMAMAVGCLPMITPKVSGVIYTADPNGLDGEEMVLSASWGLGKLVVDGEGEVDQFKISKADPYPILWQHIGKKTKQYTRLGGQGISLVAVPADRQEVPSLDGALMRKIIEGALRIEQYMKSFQDIEWSIDQEGQVTFLQARPLQFSGKLKMDKSRLITAAQKYPVLLKDQGVIASRGIGAGIVFQVQSEEDSQHFPRGAVLVLKHTSPRMSKLVPLASAVVTDIGAVTGHMATICREFRVPTIVDTYSATQVLKSGMEVTVDAEENVIYQGIVKELLTAQLIEKIPYEETYEFKLLRRLLKKISTLNITDPQSNEFDPAHCRTFHDIIRFAHEMAVRKIAQGIHPSQLSFIHSLTKLKLPIPLNLTVLDIGGGIKKGISSNEITLDEVECLPLMILLRALIAPGVWQSQPVDLDFKGFMSSFSRSPSTEAFSTEKLNINLAIVSREYLNLNLNLGYHFNLIDGNMSEDRNSNYIYFRFFGGVTETNRRTRRVKLLAQILEINDFAVESKGELITARIKKVEQALMGEKFRLIGRLIGFTRQLDVLLRNEKDIDFFADKFLKEEQEQSVPSL
ncbi:MAG: pyruvate, water dikinase [Deltaproteobacteria bacterium]|nr:pyruvate, water dikinase [Deltaproteobacteria bacterium]